MQTKSKAFTVRTDFFRNDNAETLIVFLHGLRQKAGNYETLFEDLHQDDRFSKSDAIGFSYDARALSNADPDEIAHELATEVEELSKSHAAVVLMGHSLGGLIARRTLLIAEERNLLWTNKIDRLVLLASTNRGYVPRSSLERGAASLQRKIPFFSRMVAAGLRGSPWINRLRIDWAERFEENPPQVIQVLGMDDEVVESDDSVDLMYYPNAHEIRIPGVRHSTFCQPESLPEDALKQIKDCFFHEFVPRLRNAEDTSLIVILVHGIRDFAEWHESLSQAIHQHEPSAVVVSVQYGYFSAFQFLQGLQRKRAARIFADKYIQTRLKYPSKLIAVAAHSNGTYAVASSIEDLDYIAVDRLYLAGSVLPRKFPWTKFKNQVGVIRNDIANADWPVGVLCRAFRVFLRGIGTAGFQGFTDPMVENNQCLDGPHGAALEPPYRAEVAEFLCTGEPTKLRTLVAARKPALDLFSHFALPGLLVLCAAFFGLLWVFAWAVPPMAAVLLGAATTAALIIILSAI